MDRAFVIQTFLNMFERPDYLEIGVDAGQTFQAVNAASKTAVDPAFKFPVPPNSDGNPVKYHQVTSDVFFAGVAPTGARFDVVFVDGLHTFEQVLRDTLNAVSMLKPFGVVVVDDITPNSYHSALPSLTQAFQVRDYVSRWHPELEADATWMGDVYKLAFFVRSFVQQVSFASVQESQSQLVLWRQAREAEHLGSDTMRDLAFLDFKDTVLRRDVFEFRPLADIVRELGARPGFTPAA